jgi:hypothetical protein
MFDDLEKSRGPVEICSVANARCIDRVPYLLAIIKEVFLTMNLLAGVPGGISALLRPLRGRHDPWVVIPAMVAIDAGLRIGPHRRRIGNR